MAEVDNKYVTPDKQEVANGDTAEITEHIVTLRADPPDNMVNPHVINPKPGQIITFYAKNSAFAITIPKAKDLFEKAQENTLSFRVKVTEVEQMMKIKSEASGIFEYSVYCEETKKHAYKPGASPPKIVIP